MAVWRTKACELLGRSPGAFSFKRGVVDLADALHCTLVRAIHESNEDLIRRVFEYAIWADDQKDAGHLRSALDILFFTKLFRDPMSAAAADRFLPPELLNEKRDMATGNDITKLYED